MNFANFLNSVSLSLWPSLFGGIPLVVVLTMLVQWLPLPGDWGLMIFVPLALIMAVTLLVIDWRLLYALLVLGAAAIGIIYLLYYDPNDHSWFGSWTNQIILLVFIYPKYVVAAGLIRCLAPFIAPATPLPNS